jgi:hypothetical protein
VYPMESMDGSALGATCPEYVTVSSVNARRVPSAQRPRASAFAVSSAR